MYSIDYGITFISDPSGLLILVYFRIYPEIYCIGQLSGITLVCDVVTKKLKKKILVSKYFSKGSTFESDETNVFKGI